MNYTYSARGVFFKYCFQFWKWIGKSTFITNQILICVTMISSKSAVCWLYLSAFVETDSVLSVSWVEWRASKRTCMDRESWPFDNPKALTARTASRSHASPGHHRRPEVVPAGASWCLVGRLPVALWYIVYSVLHVPYFFFSFKFFFLATVKSWIIKMNLL